MILFFVILLDTVSGNKYSPVSAMGVKASLPWPPGYDITSSAPIVDESVFQDVIGNCRGHNRRCDEALRRADWAIQRLFDTSNMDNYLISEALFQNRPYKTSMVRILEQVARYLVMANSTVFGDNSTQTPGLLKDTITLFDGIAQIKSTSTGQKNSLKTAGKLGATAMKKLSTDIKDETSSYVVPYIEKYMQKLTYLRYLVQTDVQSQINAYVNETLTDIENQQMDYDTEYKQGYLDQLNRYNDFQSVVNQGLADSKIDTNAILTRMSLFNRSVPKFKTQWNVSEQAVSKVLLALTIKDSFTDVLDSAAKSIQNGISTLAFNLADQIVSSKAEFFANTTDIATDASNSLNRLANQIVGSDNSVNTITDSSARSSLDASVKTVAAALNSLGLSAWNDALAALNKAKGLPGSIAAAMSQITRDVAGILSQAKNRDVVNIQITFKSKHNSVKKDFDTKSQAISKNTTESISAKLSSAKIKLQSLLGAISGSTSDAVGDQTVAGTAAANQAAAGATAAELAAARAKMAADRAGAGLSTVTGVVTAGLQDALKTADGINKANSGAISAEAAKAAAAQQAFVEQSYNQLQSAAAEASGTSRQLAASSSGVSLAGFSLTDSIDADAQDLYFRINSAQGGANAAVLAAKDLANGAESVGSSLLDKMTGFENQAPEMVAAALKRISAVGTGLGAAGAAAGLAASGQVGSDALGILSNLTGYLGGIKSGGLSSGLLTAQSGLANDGNNLINNVNNVPGTVASQSAAAQALLTARANRAMSQSVAALSATAGDSNAALSSLMQFDADLVDQKRRQTLAGSKSAIDASLDATKYVLDTGANFNNASSQLIFDANAIASAGAANVTDVLTSLDDTLSDTTVLTERLLSRFGSRAVDGTSGLQSGVDSGAAEILTLVAAKLAEAQDSIVHAGGSLDPAAIATTAAQLNEYIDSLKSSFELQRKAFNTNAQQYAIRRIAAITGLSEAVVGQKATVLAGLANADASQDAVASRTTGALQSLLRAVENAKAQTGSGFSMEKISQMINGIGSGTNSLSASLANQMRSDFDGLGDSANNAAASAGTKLGGLTAGTANGAGLIGDSLANAVKLISESDTGATAAVNGGQKDVFAIAGMLKSFDQSTRAKIASMIQSVQSGNMTMAQAISAARGLQQADITSVFDVVQSLSGYVSQHEAMVNNFMSALSASRDAIATSVTAAMTDHQGVQGDIMADVANNTDQLANLHDSLLSVSPLTQTTALEDTKAEMLKSVTGVEDRVAEMVFGTPSPEPAGPSGLWFNAKTGETEGSSLAEIDSADPKVSFPNAVQNLRSVYAHAAGNITNESASFKSEVDKEMQAGTNLLNQIVATVKSSMLLV